jgi:hypothetical protein
MERQRDKSENVSKEVQKTVDNELVVLRKELERLKELKKQKELKEKKSQSESELSSEGQKTEIDESLLRMGVSSIRKFLEPLVLDDTYGTPVLKRGELIEMAKRAVITPILFELIQAGYTLRKIAKELDFFSSEKEVYEWIEKYFKYTKAEYLAMSKEERARIFSENTYNEEYWKLLHIRLLPHFYSKLIF